MKIVRNVYDELLVEQAAKNNKNQIFALLKVILNLKKLLPKHHVIVGGLLNGEIKD